MKKYLFIHNPAANRNRYRHSFASIRQLISSEIQEHTFITSQSNGETVHIARQNAADYDVIVACGGDGTIRQTVTGIMDHDVSLGILPLGSGNDFAKSCGIPTNIKRALHILKKAKQTSVDIGRCNGFYFVNTLGFGFDGLTNTYASMSNIKNGTLRYLFAALKANSTWEPFEAELELDGKVITKSSKMMITVANGRVEGGSFNIAPYADLCDGLFDVITVDPVSKWLLPLQLPFFVAGKHIKLPVVDYSQAQKCHLNISQPVDIHADGEIIKTEATDFLIEVLPAKITIIGP